MMTIDITPSARRYIRENGSEVTVKLVEKLTNGCKGNCTRLHTCPELKMGKPENAKSEYEQINDGDIIIFAHNNLKNKSPYMQLKVDLALDELNCSLVMRS